MRLLQVVLADTTHIPIYIYPYLDNKETNLAILLQDKTVQSVPVGEVLYNNRGQKYHTEYKNRTHLHMQVQEEFLLVWVWLEQSPTPHLPLTCSIYLLWVVSASPTCKSLTNYSTSIVCTSYAMYCDSSNKDSVAENSS